MTFDLDIERQQLAKQRLSDAIEQYQQAKEAENTEALENRLDEIAILQGFQNERPRPEIIEWEDILNIERREWLIPQWLPANTVTMFTGEGGAGKSWLTLQAVCQVVCGFRDAYLDPDFEKVADVTTHRNVIFATYEDEPAEIKRRLHQLANGMPWIADSMETIKRHLHIVDMRGIGSVWGPGIGKNIANTGDLLAAGEDLREICESKQAKLLVMDPLSGAFGSNENDRTAVYDFVSSFRGWGDTAKCAMLVIGHLPKSQEGKAAGFSGSTAWEASARSMWMLSKKSFTEGEKNDKETKHYWALEHTKSNYAPLQSMIPLIKRKSGWWKQANDRSDAQNGFEAYQQGIEHPSVSEPLTGMEDTHDESDDIADLIANS